MTRYSRNKIELMLSQWVYELSLKPGVHSFEEGLVKAVSQLLEENRILREGVVLLADENNWSEDNWGVKGVFYEGKEIASKTLTAADSVGKEKG